MKRTKKKISNRHRRAYKVRAKVKGTAERPRLNVFRSLKHVSAQLIDDDGAKSLVAASDKDVKEKKKGTELAKEVGKALAAKALKKKINSVVFDRGPYAYHGKVKALAEGAREGGLKF